MESKTYAPFFMYSKMTFEACTRYPTIPLDGIFVW